MKKRHLVLLASLLLLICPGFYNALIVRSYSLDHSGISQPVRIAFITDLHSCAYGEGQHELLDALHAETPDLILLGGDIFDDDLPDDNTIAFLEGISGKYPCYYVTGNHEYWSGAAGFAEKMRKLTGRLIFFTGKTS